MISDVLFSAVEQMDAYLDDPLYRDMYKGATRKELKALRALERWFKQNRAPVQLHEEQIGGAEVFEIRARAPGLRWRLAHAASDDPRGEDFRRSLEDWFGRRTFAASEAAKRLGASVRTVNRRLQALEAEGWVESLGQGRARKHRLR
jgi:predicted Rossmann fold nucleotide-binding protein DprA/Smf involved in DNA uptake